MSRRKKLFKLLFGVVLGVLVSQFAATKQPPCLRPPPPSLEPPPPNQNLVFVGVMTAAHYLDSRAAAVHATWGRRVPGRLVFFSSEGSQSGAVPLVALPGVDDAYPPQKKSFMMLKYIYEHFIDDFEWFVRADDDVYIRMDRLEELLRSVDSRKAWFIGQTGRGNSEEFGMLSLENDENFCMGGPGVIFSRETLRRMAPFVDECLKNMYTTHEDVEVGRCVRRFAGISCTWSYEMQVIFYHNQSGSAAFTGDLKQKEVHRAITLHPVKRPQDMYRLHKYFKGLKIQTLQQDSVNLHRDLSMSMSELGYGLDQLQNATIVSNLPLFPVKKGSAGYLGDPKLLGRQQSLLRFKPNKIEDVLDFELIAKSLYSFKDMNPRRRIGTCIKEGLGDIVRDIMDTINSYSKQRGRVIDFKEILYGYWRLDPLHGVDLILDLLLVYRKYRGHKMTVQVRRHAYVQQTFTAISIREVHTTGVPTQPPQIINKLAHFLLGTATNSTINLILPLSGRFATFQRFLHMYQDICARDDLETRLYVILHSSPDFAKTLQLIKETNKDIRVISSNATFSRARALETGLRELKEHEMALFIDVDIVFDSSVLDRIRRNTQFGKSIYFPVVYSLYDPRPLNRSYPFENYEFFARRLPKDERSGFWRQFGFGIVSLYRGDYEKLGGFDLTISGWGLEDVSFYDRAVGAPDLKVVRSVDPGLVHVFHEVDCGGLRDAGQMGMCVGTKGAMLGSLQTLQEMYRGRR